MPETEPKRCLGCGYILEYLPELRCPECGRSFDPADATTYRAKPIAGQRYLILALGAATAIVLSTFPVPLHLLGLTGWIALGGLLVEAVILLRASKALQTTQAAVRHRPCLVIAAVISGLAVVGCGGYLLIALVALLVAIFAGDH
jgi:hypothetical protein